MPNGHSPGVHAPYGFVPVSGHVQAVQWADRVSQDVPFADGVCGHLAVRLEATTPLCVGGEREGGVLLPYATPDGAHALPGTAVKGMLRNVLEIVTFGKLQLVDRERRFAVRDLNNAPLYRNRMTETVKAGGRDVYVPKARPGWLRATGDSWEIEPCEVSRAEQRDLLDYLEARAGRTAAEVLWGCFTGRSSLVEKYAAWKGAEQPLDLAFDPGPEADHSMSRGSGHLRFCLAHNLGAGATAGTLVLTGQPSPNRRLVDGESRGKHREFVFHSAGGTRLVVAPNVRRDFELNHSASRGERHGGQEEPLPEWGYWRGRLKDGERVPVFYLAEGGSVTSLGLTQMYRLAYRHTIGDLIDRSSIQHHPDPGSVDPALGPPVVDLPDALFGYVRSAKSGGVGTKGRVSCGLFRLVEGGPEERPAPYEAVLGSPKPTYYPAYVDQAGRLDAGGERLAAGREYLTYMDGDAEVRGWKRYPVRPEARVTGRVTTEAVAVRWRALRAGSVFEGRIRLHNVRPAELGALLWALELGEGETDAPERRHSLGYARPFGFGAVTLRVVGNGLRRAADGEPASLAEAREAFAAYQAGWWGEGWEGSEQVVQLLAMADPGQAAGRDLTYMVLDGQRNEFAAAKGRDAKHVLPAYAPFDGKRDRERFPRRSAEQAWKARVREAELELGRVEEEQRRREAEEQAVRERKRRQGMTPRQRAVEDLGGLRGLPVPEQVERLLAERPGVPEEDAAAPAEWATALGELLGPPLEEVARLAEGGGGEVEALERELAEAEASKPSKKDKIQLKRWQKGVERLQRQVAGARARAQGGEERRRRAGELLGWLAALRRG